MLEATSVPVSTRKIFNFETRRLSELSGNQEWRKLEIREWLELRPIEKLLLTFLMEFEQ